MKQGSEKFSFVNLKFFEKYMTERGEWGENMHLK